jgi:hypothetical protein
MPSYGLLTNPSNEIISEISKIYELNFEYAEIGIEGPEGNPDIINKKKDEIVLFIAVNISSLNICLVALSSSLVAIHPSSVAPSSPSQGETSQNGVFTSLYCKPTTLEYKREVL